MIAWCYTFVFAMTLPRAKAMVLLAGVVALGGYLWKQFNNFKNRKMRFMQALTQNLYFKNLDNNAGVFYRLATLVTPPVMPGSARYGMTATDTHQK